MTAVPVAAPVSFRMIDGRLDEGGGGGAAVSHTSFIIRSGYHILAAAADRNAIITDLSFGTIFDVCFPHPYYPYYPSPKPVLVLRPIIRE